MFSVHFQCQVAVLASVPFLGLLTGTPRRPASPVRPCSHIDGKKIKDCEGVIFHGLANKAGLAVIPRVVRDIKVSIGFRLAVTLLVRLFLCVYVKKEENKTIWQ